MLCTDCNKESVIIENRIIYEWCYWNKNYRYYCTECGNYIWNIFKELDKQLEKDNIEDEIAEIEIEKQEQMDLLNKLF